MVSLLLRKYLFSFTPSKTLIQKEDLFTFVDKVKSSKTSNTMLDIKEFLFSDLESESRRVDVDYQQILEQLEQQINNYEQQMQDLHEKKKLNCIIQQVSNNKKSQIDNTSHTSL